MNLTGILDVFDQLPQYKKLVDRLKKGPLKEYLQLPADGRPALLARLLLELERPALLVTGRVESVAVWQQALEGWLPAGYELLRFPEPTPLPFERGPWSELSRNRRLSILTRLMAGQNPQLPGKSDRYLILSSARALLHKTLPRRRFVSTTRVLRQGQILNLQKLMFEWQTAGYERVSVVETRGQFSRRGGIVDVFPIGAKHPTRIELFGDQVETLRPFDPATQRSGDLDFNGNEYIVIPPACEVLPGDAISLGSRLETEALSEPDDLPGWQEDVPALVMGTLSPHLEYYLPMVYPAPGTFFDYLPENALLFVDDMAELQLSSQEILSHAEQVAAEQATLPPGYLSPLLEESDWREEFNKRPTLVLGDGSSSEDAQITKLSESFQPGPRFGGQVKPFLMHLRQSRARKERAVVVSQQAQRLAQLWLEEEVERAAETALVVESLEKLPAKGSITFVKGGLSGGFSLEKWTQQAAGRPRECEVLLDLLTDAEIFGWRRPAPQRRRRPRPVAPETFFADISPGDFVVQLEFGIGLFEGLVVRAIGGTDREYLQVSYANSDVLYVPVHHADRLSKWIGPDDHRPALNRLGEKTWKRTKEKAQQAVDELADELLELYAVRETVVGHAFAPDGHWQAELESSFPYQETEDQLHAIAEVKADMERPYPMDRLICGDVGYGKTEVALRAAFKAVLDGKQVAMLVPTTVLAQQHYNTFDQRLKPFPVNVEMLSRFRTLTAQERILRRLRDGKIDIVIGTHRLLSEDVSFKDLGLLIIDEEQRFGVAHKEVLKQLRSEVDVLTMTATPIPRTLYMGLSGVRDISVIDTAPADRLPVQTYVGEYDDTLMRRAILREIDRGGQVFYVHNRVQTIGNAYVKLSRLVPEAMTAMAHGQMNERELEEVMLRFVNGEVDVLLCTTIIESGLDIPNANTIIVERADRFGLAQLYQLRGRVGRGVRRAYAFFLHHPWQRLTHDAQERLDIIAAQTALGSGYNLAMRDLEMRGSGDLLGSRQSGHIASVGFDLYTRLLAQAVKRRKAARNGEKLAVDLPDSVLIDMPLAAYIPTDYVPESSLRLRLYRRMARLDLLSQIDDMAVELADRFGPIPDPVDNLLYQLRIKVMARTAKIASITTESGQIQIRFPQRDGLNRINLQRYLGSDVRVSRNGIWLTKDLTTRQWQIALVQVLEKLQSAEM